MAPDNQPSAYSPHVTQLRIRAGARAFGDGTHPTTQLLGELLKEFSGKITPRTILDMGCGSGILSLQAALLYPDASIIAADIEAEAVSATQVNAQENRIEEHITALRSDGYSHPHIAENAPYDLILCNILAEPLVAMAADAGSMVKLGGHIMLSGILRWQADTVRAAYAAAGLQAIEGLETEDWVAMVCVKEN